MNMLHTFRESDHTPHEITRTSPMKAWLVRHGHSSLVKYAQLEVANFKSPLIFQVFIYYNIIFFKVYFQDNLGCHEFIKLLYFKNHLYNLFGKIISLNIKAQLLGS